MPRTTEEKIIIAKKFLASRMSKRSFCQKNQMSVRTLNNYLLAFNKPVGGTNPPLKYVELPHMNCNPSPSVTDEAVPVSSAENVPEIFALEMNGVKLSRHNLSN